LKKPSLKISSIYNWIKVRNQKHKENDEFERSLESSSLKMITFIVTLVAMALGMSYLPLFPQPLPIFLAVLVAFVTYLKPRIGMPIGGAIIGLGLMYHLALLYFISFLGEPAARIAFVAVWIALFIILPLLYNRYKAALAIDFGIFAVVAVLIEPTLFLAIPLILASAVFFKKYVGLTVVYYILLTVPLQIVQYYQYTVLPIVRSEWWLEPGSAPPLFVSLSKIVPDLGLPMSQFRLYETSNAIYAILGQTTWIPDWTGRTMEAAVKQYVDSIPGILMFAVIVIGLALIMIFFTRMLAKEGLIGSGDKVFPCFTATISAALFFILLSAFQVPLAFTAEVTAITMVLGIFTTLLFTLPVAFIDLTPKQAISNKQITDKSRALIEKVLAFEEQLTRITETIPLVVTSLLGKNGIIEETLQELIKRSEARMYDQYELEQKLQDLDTLEKQHSELVAELNTILIEYQTFTNCEYANWLGKIKQTGIPAQSISPISYQKEVTIEERTVAIRQVLDAGKEIAKEVLANTEPIYGIIRSLYDPSLPLNNRAVEFAQEKLSSKEAPWIAIEALYNALNNWKRQYGNEIQTSMRYLQGSLKPLAYLSLQSEILPSVFGESTTKVIGHSKNAEVMRVSAEKRLEKDRLEIVDVVALKDDILAYIDIANDLLSMLYGNLISMEEDIEHLLPTKDYLWEKNMVLRERLEIATKQLSNPSSYKINEILQKLPQYLPYIEEAMKTLAMYSERKEFLLNYPLAEVTIAEKLKTKEELLPKDLPFQPQFAAEYLRLYYSQRYGEYTFDKDNLVLTKRS
jgi:hypothetical protein